MRAGARPEEDPLFRTAVNVAKYVCSTDAGLAVHHAIEVLGGNGTIEDFSPLPRLYREVPVQESWEGPHNTLMAQLLRDALRSKMHAALLEAAQETLLGISARDLVGTRDRAQAAVAAPAWLPPAADLLLQRAMAGYDSALDPAYPAMVAQVIPD